MMLATVLLFTLAGGAATQSINCPGGVTSPQGRDNAVNFHNILRSSIAQGRSTPGPTSASNMYALNYDCSLETLAQAYANRCPTAKQPDAQRPSIGQNLYRLGLPPSRVPEPDTYTYAATQWWNEVIHKGYNAGADNIYTAAVAASGISSYAQMAWALTTRVGCALNSCPGGIRVIICNYQTKGPVIGQPMVAPGPSCTSDAMCNTFPGSTCNFALSTCSVPPGTNPEPPATTVAPGMTTTTTAATATTTKNAVQACTAAPRLTPAVRKSILTAHNTLRTKIARGKEIEMVLMRGCQNMFTMTYDCALEEAAQRLADRCDSVANPSRRGQNVYMNNAGEAPAAAVTAAIAQWQAEIGTGPFVVNAPLSTVAGQPNEVSAVGQFASMAYNRAYHVGCGYAKCNATAVILLCRYRLPRSDTGRVFLASTTEKGCTPLACSKINNTATCNTKSGLCQFP